jgi:hypothetical protein
VEFYRLVRVRAFGAALSISSIAVTAKNFRIRFLHAEGSQSGVDTMLVMLTLCLLGKYTSRIAFFSFQHHSVYV